MKMCFELIVFNFCVIGVIFMHLSHYSLVGTPLIV